jgi:hypothetical protein
MRCSRPALSVGVKVHFLAILDAFPSAIVSFKVENSE